MDAQTESDDPRSEGIRGNECSQDMLYLSGARDVGPDRATLKLFCLIKWLQYPSLISCASATRLSNEKEKQAKRRAIYTCYVKLRNDIKDPVSPTPSAQRPDKH